jgi:DNA mismatch repair protein MutS2
LKMYAGTEPGVVNASVEFDEKTLRPTYRLIVGVAGSSSGLEIARRFGVPETITKAAVESVKDSSRQSTEYLRIIKREAEDAENLRKALEEERAAVAEKFATLDKTAAKHERERQIDFERILQLQITEFEKKARELVGRIQDRAERLKVEREAQRQTAEIKREAQRTLRAATSTQPTSVKADPRNVRIVRDGQVVARDSVETNQTEEVSYIPVPQREITVGDKVKLRSFGSIGIVDKIKGDEAEVRVKALRFRERLDNLELVEVQTASGSEQGKLEKLRRAAATEVHLRAETSTQSEINVIGQTTDEAVDAVDKFLDAAAIGNLSEIRIVHGHGTGALRRAITELLKDHPHVDRFLPAPPNQGGTGATIVQLRSAN